MDVVVEAAEAAEADAEAERLAEVMEALSEL
jgi:hypothetical protein